MEDRSTGSSASVAVLESPPCPGAVFACAKSEVNRVSILVFTAISVLKTAAHLQDNCSSCLEGWSQIHLDCIEKSLQIYIHASFSPVHVKFLFQHSAKPLTPDHPALSLWGIAKMVTTIIATECSGIGVEGAIFTRAIIVPTWRPRRITTTRWPWRITVNNPRL